MNINVTKISDSVFSDKYILAIAYPATSSYSLMLKISGTNNYENIKLVKSDKINANVLIESLGILPAYPYLKLRAAEYEGLLFVYQDKSVFNFVNDNTFIRMLYSTAKRYELEHRNYAKNILLEQLRQEEINFNELVLSIKNYTFSARFSIWVYNKFTRHCICIISDRLDLVDEVIEPQTPNNRILDFINSGQDYESRPVDEDAVHSLYDEGMRSLTRILVRFANDTPGVISLASPLPEFYVRPDTTRLIRALCLHTHNSEYEPLRKAFNTFVDVFARTEANSEENISKAVTQKVTEVLDFEACSIYLEDNNELRWISTTDALGINLSIGKPYKLNEESLTGSVFQNNEIIFSYKIKDEELNSNNFNEECILDESNWIGLPIALEDGTKFGVLRVKNKFSDSTGEKSIAPLRATDFNLLKKIASNLAYHLLATRRQNTLKRESLVYKNKLSQFQDHIRIFLHEVRTPAQSFLNTPRVLSRMLDNSSIKNEEKLAIQRKLRDLVTLSERLKFIVSCQRREHLFRDRSKENLFILNDVIMPLMNTYQPYMQMQYGVNVNLIDDLMFSRKIVSDAKLLAIALNILLDNAGKYTADGSDVQLIGEKRRGSKSFFVIIENNGYEIDLEEVDFIFEDSVRGKKAKALQIEGTGVGLHLAREISIKCGFKITLESRFDPVRFSVEIPEAAYE